MDIFFEVLKAFCIYFVELSILFLGISFFVALVNYKYEEKIKAFLNKDSLTSYLKAIVLGSLTPFCSCSTIPLFKAFLQSGVKLSVCMAYLFTSPLINPIIITMLLVTFGMMLSISYVVFLVVMILILSLLLAKLDSKTLLRDDFSVNTKKNNACCTASKQTFKPVKKEQKDNANSTFSQNLNTQQSNFSLQPAYTPLHANQTVAKFSLKEPLQKPDSCCNTALNFKGVRDKENAQCCVGNGNMIQESHSKNTMNFKTLCRQISMHSFYEYKKVLPYLLVGMAIGAFIHGFVPQGILEEYFKGLGIFGVILAAFLGILLYIRAETLIPIGLALIDSGVNSGVVMSFLIAGAGCSLPELILLKSMFSMRALGIFVAMVLGIAIAFGIFVMGVFGIFFQ